MGHYVAVDIASIRKTGECNGCRSLPGKTMIEQITAIILGFAFASIASLVSFVISRYLSMSWRAIRQEK